MSPLIGRQPPGGEPVRHLFALRGLPALARAVAAILLILGLLAGATVAVQAQDAPPDTEATLQDVGSKTREIEVALGTKRLGSGRIEEYRSALEAWRKTLLAAADATRAAIQPLKAELDALGPAPEKTGDEAEELAAKRAELEARAAPLDAQLKRIQAMLTQIQALSDRLVEFRRERFTREILERQPTPVSLEGVRAARDSLSTRLSAIAREVQARLDGDDAGELFDRLALPLLIAFAAFALAFWLRRRLVRWIRGRVDQEVSRPRRARLTAAVTLVRLTLPTVGVAMTVTAVRASGLLGPNGTVLMENATLAAICLILAYAFGGAFFAPYSRGLRVSRLSDWRATSGFRWYVLLTFVVAADQMMVAGGRELRLTVEALSVMNAALMLLGGFSLWRLVRAIGLGAPAVADDAENSCAERSRNARIAGTGSRMILSFTALVSPLLALFGYYAASRFLFYPVVYTSALIGAAIIVYLWVVAFSAGRADGGNGDEAVGDAAEPAEAPLSAVPVIAGFVLMVLVLPLLSIIWGARATDLSSAWSLIVDGFRVGDITIAPMDFVVFAIVFAIGYFLTRIVQGILRSSVMPVLRIDDGAKAALLAGVGYIGIVATALVAISTTALDLSNLAIVAGALSVGIGFGLQNVVNNFVSGIILLIERPIKVGDWVEIGGTHGMVRRINVRSTQIQKFDRSTMFVPNADLISGTVTNMYHGDGQGQLKLAVGVAYGSDVRKVEQILLDAANAHPMILRTPAPFVIFADFGASSLDFELRGIMADVNMILTLPSELRYAIYRRFAEEGIEIPYAHRDITIRNIQDLKGLGGTNA